ncbi:MAG: site-2 protease family protein [Clostridia bacterium]|jgi:Zn-dependent protease|nr:site-2 protease family protein [Clostridia bacterium]
MFNFSFDKRTMYIIVAVMAGIAVLQYATNPGGLIGLLLSAPGVLIAITFHEFAHGYAAYKLGDNTAKSQGRLSLNPFAHLDPIGTLLLLVAGFGWGKPVEVNPRNYTRKMSMEKGEAIVSAAGPLMNFVLAIIFTLIYCAIYKFASATFLTSTVGWVILLLVSSTISINIGLGVFNLIPLPPLDGSKIIMPFLPYKAKEFFVNNEQIFYIIFILIWITGVAGTIITPAISGISKGILSLGTLIFGL